MAVVIATSAAHAAGPADEDLAAAEAAAKHGDFVATAAAFKRAYAKDPRPELICNVGVAYYKAKELARAQLFLSRCLERGSALDAKFVDNVRTVLGSVESTMRASDFTPVDIVVEPAGATITMDAFGDDEAVVGSRVVWLPFGKHRLVARFEGYADRLVELETTARASQRVRITLDKAQVVETPKPPPPVVTKPKSPPPPPPPVVTEPVRARSKVPAIVATSASVAGLVLAIVGHQQANAAADRARFAVSMNVYNDDKSSVSTWNAVTITGASVAVVGAAVGGYLWFRALHTDAPVEVAPTSGGATARVTIRW